MTINRRRIFAFTATVIILCTIITATIPRVLEEVRLGLDLKGGFEVLYEAQPLEPGGVITPESLRQTAASLEKELTHSVPPSLKSGQKARTGYASAFRALLMSRISESCSANRPN